MEIMIGEENCECHKPSTGFSSISCHFLTVIKAFSVLKFLKSVVMVLPWSLYTNPLLCLGQAHPSPIIIYPCSNTHSSPVQHLFLLRAQLHPFLQEGFPITFLFCVPVLCHSPHFFPITALSKTVSFLVAETGFVTLISF